jgi:hypothetical protein
VGSIKAVLSRLASLAVINKTRVRGGVADALSDVGVWPLPVAGRAWQAACIFLPEGPAGLRSGRKIAASPTSSEHCEALAGAAGRQAVAKPQEVPPEVGQIRDLQLGLVDPQDGEQMRTWNELMVREHPQGQRRLVGRQLRYLVGSATRARSTACWPFLMRGEATPHRPFPRIRSPGLAICGFAANTVMA